MASCCTRGGSGWILGTISAPREQGGGESPSVEAFQSHGDVALRDVGSGHGGGGLGLDLET